MTTTVYIVPAKNGDTGACRVVIREGKVASPPDDYRHNTQAWKEIGLMNSHGRLITIDADRDDIIDELRFCEPLHAGLHFEVEDEVQVEFC